MFPNIQSELVHKKAKSSMDSSFSFLNIKEIKKAINSFTNPYLKSIDYDIYENLVKSSTPVFLFDNIEINTRRFRFSKLENCYALSYKNNSYIICERDEYNAIIRKYFDKEIFNPKPELFNICTKILDNKVNVGHYGIILYGDPGNGKSTFCRKLMNYCKINDIDYTIVYKSQSYFETAGLQIIDDLDIKDLNIDSQFYEKLLSNIDGANRGNFNVLNIFCTNADISEISEALLRFGRTDKIVRFENPALDEISEFVKYIGLNVDPANLEGFSYAEIDFIKREKSLYPEKDYLEIFRLIDEKRTIRKEKTRVGFKWKSSAQK